MVFVEIVHNPTIVAELSKKSVVFTKDIAGSFTKAYLIENFKGIDPAWLTNIKNICLSSGASAPDTLIEEIIKFLQEKHGFCFTDE